MRCVNNLIRPNNCPINFEKIALPDVLKPVSLSNN